MPTVEENLSHWSSYDWTHRGDEWAAAWGGPDQLWFGSLYPRVRDAMASAQTILEIAPGFGRITRFLKDDCRRLILVDLTERCIEACRERFQADEHVEFHVNDGYTLPMVADHSVDFAFSFDSLVHTEADVVDSYLKELSRVLCADGLAFLHHSNFGEFVDGRTGRQTIGNLHWRGRSVSASSVRQASERIGLRCVSQELVDWGDRQLTDCFSLITPQGSKFERSTTIARNPQFMEEASRMRGLRELYSLAR